MKRHFTGFLLIVAGLRTERIPVSALMASGIGSTRKRENRIRDNDWWSGVPSRTGVLACFGRMREVKRKNTRCGL
jgi:hypothetical protein